MLKTRSLLIQLLAIVTAFTTLAFATLASAQTETPATIPANLVGTYEATYSHFGPATGSPFSNGDTANFVVGADNTLCINNLTLSNPVLRNGNGHEAIWKDEAAGVEYALSSLITGFNEVNIAGNNATPFYGQVRGSKVSDSTTCSTQSGGTVTQEMNTVFDLAESKLADLFPSGAVTQFQEDYVYRLYSTGIYLAFQGGNVFLLGGSFGDSITEAGSISSVISYLNGPSITTEMQDMFSLLESKFATLFPSGGITTTLGDAVIRSWASSGITVTIRDGAVFVRGGSFGSVDVSAGTIAAVVNQVNNPAPTGGGSTGGGSTGNDFTLTITGSINVLGIAQVFPNIVVENIAAPDAASTQAIENAITTQLEGVANGVSSIQFTVINNSADQVTFDVSFNATLNGISVSYQLRYDYKR